MDPHPKRVVYLLGMALMASSPLSYSHEYWLDPIDPSVSVGDKIIVDIRNGQDYAGASFPYDSAKYKSIVINSAEESTTYAGRLGDYPAIHHIPTIIGLHSISVDTAQSTLVYESWTQFSNFLDYHGLAKIKDRHLAKQYPKTQIKEQYYRSAKTYIEVHSETTLDAPSVDTIEPAALAPVGSLFEMVPLTNPYDAETELSIQLLFDNSPLTERQVEMFWKGSPLVRLTTTTDNNGIATFKLLGDGDYLFNAVQVVEPENSGIHWISHWASITFER